MQAVDITGHKTVVELTRAPSLVPDTHAIDYGHLARLTGGNDDAMLEVLRVFDLQADLLLARIMSEAPKAAAARAHTLADSARSVGAWRVAEAAGEVERLALAPGPVVLGSSMGRLSAAVNEALVEIHNRTRT